MAVPALLAVGLFWFCVWFIDRRLRKSSYFLRYGLFLDQNNVTVEPGKLVFYTTKLNRLFIFLGHRFPAFLQVWFTVGVGFGLISMLASVLLLSYSLVSQLTRPPEEQVLTPVLPGVNLPINQLGYFFVALAVAGILHEMGHGIAAVIEKVQVRGFGVFVMLLYPGAFVDLTSEQMDELPPTRQMRIFCAGVWHNFVLCVVCFLGFWAIPILLLPLYSLNNGGANVMWLHEQSPIRGHVHTGSIIERLDDCIVRSSSDWQRCIQLSLNNQSSRMTGFCVPNQNLNVFPQSIYTCCQTDVTTSEVASSSICFASPVQNSNLTFCLPARQVVSNPGCDLDSDCEESNRATCLRPQLLPWEHLLRIKLRDEPLALFVGDPRAIWWSSMTTDSRPRFSFLPFMLPWHLQRLCEYTLSISAALSLLNMFPAFYLDGQWVLIALVNVMFPHWRTQHRAILTNFILSMGTLLFGATIVVSFVILIM